MDAGQLLAFLPAATLVAASPGANNLLALTNGIRSGFRPTVASLAGRLAAFALMIAAVALGLGAVLEASELAFTAIKWIGVAYLAWLGLRLVRSRTLDVDADAGGGREREARSLIRREFVVAVTNPKAMLLFTAFLPQFVRPDDGYAGQLFALGAVYVAVEGCAACGYAFAGTLVRRVEMTPERVVAVNRTTGAMMLGAAALLAVARRD